MSRKTKELKNEMVAAAARLRALKEWSCREDDRSKLLETMQQGGERATEAWVYLLKEIVKLPPAIRSEAEKRLSHYRQSIGRWFIAEHNEHFPEFSWARAGSGLDSNGA